MASSSAIRQTDAAARACASSLNAIWVIGSPSRLSAPHWSRMNSGRVLRRYASMRAQAVTKSASVAPGSIGRLSLVPTAAPAPVSLAAPVPG